MQQATVEQIQQYVQSYKEGVLDGDVRGWRKSDAFQVRMHMNLHDLDAELITINEVANDMFQEPICISIPYMNDSPLHVYCSVMPDGRQLYTFTIGSPELYSEDKDPKAVLYKVAQDIITKLNVARKV